VELPEQNLPLVPFEYFVVEAILPADFWVELQAFRRADLCPKK